MGGVRADGGGDERPTVARGDEADDTGVRGQRGAGGGDSGDGGILRRQIYANLKRRTHRTIRRVALAMH